MRDDLNKFCRKVAKLGATRDVLLRLSVQMNWWEMYLSWLPLVRKDRIEEYRSNVAIDIELSRSIPELRAKIIDKLDDFVKRLLEAKKETADCDVDNYREMAAVNAVWAAFYEFSEKFKDYNWFFRLGSDKGKRSFLCRYPDGYHIYITALSSSQAE